ncbi:MAG: hypothetical protein MZV64_34540 [Ignavibacteriales bacterium]|nr:hypothetical protein [Ignavibacteriales bacterium]
MVGATGLVGSELVRVFGVALGFRRLPLRLFASLNTAGEKVPFVDDEVRVGPITADFGQGRDLIFFAAHPILSRDLAEEAAKTRRGGDRRPAPSARTRTCRWWCRRSIRRTWPGVRARCCRFRL